MPPCCRLVQPKPHRLMWAAMIGPEDVRATIPVEIGDEKVVCTALGHDHFSPTVALPAVEIHTHLLRHGALVHARSHDVSLSVAIPISATAKPCVTASMGASTRRSRQSGSAARRGALY